MIHLTFPDNSVRDFEPGVTGKAVAEGISKSLSKKAVAVALDGELRDLADPIDKDARIEIVTRDDPRALELIRHDAAHVMAEAVKELYPGTQVTIGPVIENGFYYDFKPVHPDTQEDWPFTPEDFPKIEAKMRELIARRTPPSPRRCGSATTCQDAVRIEMGEKYKVRARRRDPARRGPEHLPPGRVVRSVPRPAHGPPPAARSAPPSS